jgi:hypothetical protein
MTVRLRSFLTCHHRNVGVYTEFCMDCGYNIYTTEQEYLEDLRRRAAGGDAAKRIEIEALEDKLGIER